MNENAPQNNQEDGVDTSFVDMAMGDQPSVMQAVKAAQESGNLVEVAKAEAAADEKYIVDQELHDAHVTTKENFDHDKKVAEEAAAFAKMEARRKNIESQVSLEMQGKDSLDLVQTLVNLYRKNYTEEKGGASGWAPYGEAVRKIADKIPEKSRNAIITLADTGGNGMLSALANGEIERSKQSSMTRNMESVLIATGTPEQEASYESKSRTDKLVANRERSISEAEKLLATIDVDPYNLK